MEELRRHVVSTAASSVLLRVLTVHRTANSQTMTSSCAQFGMDNDSTEEINNIKSAIQSVAKESGIKAEFLLAVMMQESQGCVRAPTTNYGVNNPGLMQSYQGTYSCNPNGKGEVPCAPEKITGMIREGAGIGSQFGLQQALSQSKATDVSKYYKAARIYNSGSIAASGNLGDGIATHCYASDIANRLIGWADGQRACSESTIGGMGGSATGNGNTNDNNNDNTPTTTQPAATNTATATATAAATATATTTTGSGSQAPGPEAPGVVKPCSKWYLVKVSSPFSAHSTHF